MGEPSDGVGIPQQTEWTEIEAPKNFKPIFLSERDGYALPVGTTGARKGVGVGRGGRCKIFVELGGESDEEEDVQGRGGGSVV